MTQTEFLQALKTAITTDTDAGVIAALVIRNDIGIAEIYNQPTNPAVAAWRTNVGPGEVDDNTNWTTFDSLSAGKRDSWQMFLARNRDFTRAKVRSWIVDIWGTGAAAEALMNLGIETATYGQNRLGGTVENIGTISALDRNYVGKFSHDMVSAALNLA